MYEINYSFHTPTFSLVLLITSFNFTVNTKMFQVKYPLFFFTTSTHWKSMLFHLLLFK